MTKSLTALFGGTFDPIHYGHLLPVMALAQEIKLKHISLLPNHIPPHKPQPEASTLQRLAMLELAIEGNDLFSIDTRELSRADLNRPSFTIETLQGWRTENGTEKGLAFILGQDSLLSLPTWSDWQSLLQYCHLLVCRRPGYDETTDNDELKAWIKQHQTADIEQLHNHPNGYIYFANTPLKAISATEIRERVSEKRNCEELLPKKVWLYIQKCHLYGFKD